MNKFLHNILNPPTTIEVGQVWYYSSLGRDVLVVEKLSSGVVRCAPLSIITNLGGKDVILEKTEYDFLASDRVALSKAIIPIQIKDLTPYIGAVKLETALRAKRLYLEKDMGYDEIAKRIIAQLVEETTQAAINMFKKIEGGE